MNICFVCNEYPPAPHGGIGIFTRVLGRALVRAGHEVRVIGSPYPGTEAPPYEEDGGVRVWRVRQNQKRLGWVAARYEVARKVQAWATRGEIDLVEAPDYQGWVAGWPWMPVPLVVRMHGSLTYFAAEMGQQVGRRLSFMERAALRRADFLCSVSRYTAERTRALLRLARGPIAVLYNPVELPPPVEPRQRCATDVVFTGTLTPKKGIQSLIAAWPLVREQSPNSVLHVYGKDGRTKCGEPMREHLERELNGDPSVRFYGHVPHDVLFDALDSAAVAVFPSYSEAFGLAPLEAMAHGCATIYTRCGSGPELIRDGVDGLLVDPADPKDIAQAIVRVLADPGLGMRLGTAGRRRVFGEFSCEVQVRRNEEYYAECLDRYRWN